MTQPSNNNDISSSFTQWSWASPKQKIGISVTILISALAIFAPEVLPINSVILAISLMTVLCLIRVPVPIALITGALIGSLNSGLSVQDSMTAINNNIASGAQVGMTYIMIGAFAVALSRSGILDLFANKVSMATDNGISHTKLKWGLFSIFIIASLMSQNLIPVHIAFIPVMIPPLLSTFNRLKLDRRAIACVIACSISISYLLLPTGFGAIYLFEILLPSFNSASESYDVTIEASQVPKAMFIPVMGILAGMLVAVFISYRKPREYDNNITKRYNFKSEKTNLDFKGLVFTLLAIIATVVCQLWLDSLFLGAMLGFIILSFSGVFTWNQQDDVFTEGMRMMVQVAVIITIAAGFAGALNATGEIPALIEATQELVGDNRNIAALLMLLVGLFITIGFGDSFASVPILAPIYVPLAWSLGFSPEAAIALLGASAALGDAGSPASTISLGVTSGLNADGQHDHVNDSVIPTFLHANVGMVIFAWIAVVVL
ncbi:TRAP transporter large permease subunit [Vibrio sp.]|nr:TRAP transporter large permease subunit [Vibrio sp.]